MGPVRVDSHIHSDLYLSYSYSALGLIQSYTLFNGLYTLLYANMTMHILQVISVLFALFFALVFIILQTLSTFWKKINHYIHYYIDFVLLLFAHSLLFCVCFDIIIQLHSVKWFAVNNNKHIMNIKLCCCNCAKESSSELQNGQWGPLSAIMCSNRSLLHLLDLSVILMAHCGA